MNIINFAFTKTVYLLRKPNVVRQCKKPTLGQAHLVFADTRANAEKPKELALFHR